MEHTELLKRVRRIEIKTRGLSRNIFAGEYHSAFKGRGMAFSEVREYQYGDDIRNIDWNVTARYNKPFIKVFEEERELTVVLLVDVSGSRMFGSFEKYKKNIITEVAAVLAFSAIQNNDKIGVIFFSNKIEKFIPPKKGKSHILRIISELIDFEPEQSGTNVTLALQYLANAIKRRCTAFVISDFIDDNSNLQHVLTIAGSKHDLVALRIYDERERELPSIGMVKMKDAETGSLMWVDTSSASVRGSYKQWWEQLDKQLDSAFTKTGVDYVNISTNEDYVRSLMSLFRRRGSRM